MIYEYGSPDAGIVLLQPVDDHDLEGIENEVQSIKALTDVDFHLIAVRVDRWNTDLSPWKAPAVFGTDDFGDGAEETLHQILAFCSEDSKTYVLGGYSLAGLFALWAASRTDRFAGIAAASPSVWFPGFTDFMKTHLCKSRAVYLSLGHKEEKTRNRAMAAVGHCIREGHQILRSQNIHCSLEWNQGNHFQEPDIRTAKAFAWVIEVLESMNKSEMPV